ncbi:hypothetical protein CJ193_005830 [Pseudoglutamicibacter albus]|nr:hypothetical protein [Pseudoglutamicibacter albus]WIK83612.1 hypothetical protein CJ193_005830 [Pseudoglutamicibacter albus]
MQRAEQAAPAWAGTFQAAHAGRAGHRIVHGHPNYPIVRLKDLPLAAAD